ncbi:MAG: aldehyde dehydrogenase family protein [Flavobacteriales bacterium]
MDKYVALFSSGESNRQQSLQFLSSRTHWRCCGHLSRRISIVGLIATSRSDHRSGGNAVVALAFEQKATCAISFAEVVQNSDVPGGVINILTGTMDELGSQMSSHMDVNALVVARDGFEEKQKLEATGNVKRLANWASNWKDSGPYKILDLQEVKTTWHPVQVSSVSGGGY